ncbi:CS domain [Trinorchestia longiramus]|nr:CS domain [Trinorchestia longiramus]
MNPLILDALAVAQSQKMGIQLNTSMKDLVKNEVLRETSEYLVELHQIREFGVRTAMMRELFDAEILLCSKKIKYDSLVAEKRQMLNQLMKVHEQLRTTSRQVFREQLQTKLGALQEKINSVSVKLMEAELTRAGVKENLVQCKENLCSLIDEISEEEAPTSSAEESEDSTTPSRPWLKLCEADTGLDSYHSNLPTTTIEKFDWNQSDKFVKLYLDVPGLKKTDEGKVSPTFGERHISIFVAAVRNHNYKFIIQGLSEPIDINESKFRLKQERIVLFLKKKQLTKWTDLTAKATANRKQSVDRLLKKMRVVFTEFEELTALAEVS